MIRSVFANDLVQHEYEIVFVDDGSKDGSLQEILSLRQERASGEGDHLHSELRGIATMLAGFKEATGDAVIDVSADLQDPIELIPQMIEKWQGGAETVICCRTDRPVATQTIFALGLRHIAHFAAQIPPGGFDFVLMDRKGHRCIQCH